MHPLTVPGLGDAGAHCTMICDGSFPTYLLQFWGRDAPEDARLPMEWVVKQQCADTVALVGLRDRGVLAPGLRADINVIDLDALAIGAPEMVYDLPAGGRRLVQRATGYRATLVAGEVVTRDGEPTGALRAGSYAARVDVENRPRESTSGDDVGARVEDRLQPRADGSVLVVREHVAPPAPNGVDHVVGHRRRRGWSRSDSYPS